MDNKVSRPACPHCGKAFSWQEFPEHVNACQHLQAPASGPSFHREDEPLVLSEEQQLEIDALRSILEEDFEFVEDEGLLALTISTTSTRTMLLARYTSDYPSTPPLLAIKRLDSNISKECAKQMYQMLKAEADELAKNRSVFIFELYNTAKRFLEDTIVNGSTLHDQFLQHRQQKAKEQPQPPRQPRRLFPEDHKLPDEENFKQMVKQEHEQIIHDEANMNLSGGLLKTSSESVSGSPGMYSTADSDSDGEEEAKHAGALGPGSSDESEESDDMSQNEDETPSEDSDEVCPT